MGSVFGFNVCGERFHICLWNIRVARQALLQIDQEKSSQL
jgi:hypothetical protein